MMNNPLVSYKTGILPFFCDLTFLIHRQTLEILLASYFFLFLLGTFITKNIVTWQLTK